MQVAYLVGAVVGAEPSAVWRRSWRWGNWRTHVGLQGELDSWEPSGPSVDSLCHPCITTTHLSYSVLSLKLPPPPCAALLVLQSIDPKRTRLTSGSISIVWLFLIIRVISTYLRGVLGGLAPEVRAGGQQGRSESCCPMWHWRRMIVCFSDLVTTLLTAAFNWAESLPPALNLKCSWCPL